ncbi:glycosyltransferase family 1 protein [Nocardioides sp. ChNu-99]|uniref:glycosyltransferase family 1 protein n=1 Tax=Nocardioides sp. ChNu-99 TaxID=2839897 RepID=UPI002404E322|nr:glycosyltransferase family 1 protein [Nocardioides sp. ChNu-99]MDF9714647.1 glycosyltransferase family 1 protein [Nocardioides sp. ChNu-99]
MTPPDEQQTDHGARVVVGSVPADHAYVHHVAPLDRAGPLRLPDPPGLDADGVPTGHWWPPRLLEAAYVAEVADTTGLDLLHVHFGFEGRTPEQLAEVVATLHARGRALVLTVHDLRNPHLPDAGAHEAQLDVLVPAADALVTLTDGAADAVERRWGRRPTVVPHPHVVPLDAMEQWQARRAPRSPGAPMRVGVDLKSLRANVAARDVLPALVDAVAALPGSTLQVAVHAAALRPDAPRHDPDVVRLLDEAGRRDHVEVLVHDYLPDDDLWAHLAALDVSVLPYRFGTHSGWLEACRDLGTDVVAPRGGFYRDQGPVDLFDLDDDGIDAGSLTAALRAAHERGSRPPVSVAERRAQRAVVADAHDAVYAQALAAAAHHH